MANVKNVDLQKLYIDGKWINADGGSTLEVINPATKGVIAEVTSGRKEEAKLAVDAATAAFKDWSERPAVEKADLLLALYNKVLEKQEEIARVITLEAGKPLMQAMGEVKNGAEYIRWNAEEARRIYGTTVESSDAQKRLQIKKEAVGPVAAITPWNFPFAMVTRKVSPALAAGCTVVLKPSEETPMSAVKLFEIAEEVGFPKGVMNLVIGDPQPIGDVWLTDKRIKKVTFTGSTNVGKILYKRASDQVKRVSMELGGHAPIIVFDDCDMEKSIQQILKSKLNNSGQTCISPNRIYVQESIINEFTEKLGEMAKNIKIGDGTKSDSDIGPLINAAGLKKVETHVKDAVEKGATVVAGGKTYEEDGCENGFFYSPTVLKGVNESMIIANEETFGPVAPILSFTSDEEIIEIANDTDYGLAAYIFTRDLSRSHRVSEALEYGMVGVNDTVLAQVEGAFGGMKESGFGREGGPDALEDFLEKKFISTQL